MTDERVEFVAEPATIEQLFRELSSSGTFASPKLWADAYLIAIALSREQSGNLDQALGEGDPPLFWRDRPISTLFQIALGWFEIGLQL